MATFSNQALLPALPVPPLQHTMEELYKSLIPFTDSSTCTPDQLHAEIKDFEKGLGKQLQQRLLDHAKNKRNWLDKWWFQLAYHSWREPLPVNSNWFMVFKDHPEQPQYLLHPKLELVPAGHVTLFQIYRTAGLITNAIGMKEAIERQEIPIEKLPNGTSLCMNQYKMMFGWCRVPLPDSDTIVCPGGFPSTSKHIIVLLRNQVYVLQVYDVQGRRFSINALQHQLLYIVNDVNNRTKLEAPICLMTGDQRDNWAQAREYLTKLHPQNSSNLELIESSLFSVSLDDWSLPDDYDLSYQNIAHATSGNNRWYDKTISIICMSNGRAGMNGEHSPCDALIPSRLMDCEPAKDPVGSAHDPLGESPKLLKWKIDSRIEKYIDRAQFTLNSIVRDSDAGVLIFSEYGSDFIKKHGITLCLNLKEGKVSPDAFVQMALQLAYYRLHGKWTATYETGSTRQFAYGRTETIRTCSVDAVNFVKTFMDPTSDRAKTIQAFKKACISHTKYTVMAMQGNGVDRHFLGLRQCLRPGETHPLLKNPLLTTSTYYRLSTSGLSSGENYNGTGFGAVVPDGYGTNYCIGSTVIKFGVESKKSCRETSTENFKAAVVASFRDLKVLLENDPKISGKL